MKTIVEWDMETDEADYLVYLKRHEMRGALYEIANRIRTACKHGDSETISVETMKSEFWEVMKDYDLDPYEI